MPNIWAIDEPADDKSVDDLPNKEIKEDEPVSDYRPAGHAVVSSTLDDDLRSHLSCAAWLSVVIKTTTTPPTNPRVSSPATLLQTCEFYIRLGTC